MWKAITTLFVGIVETRTNIKTGAHRGEIDACSGGVRRQQQLSIECNPLPSVKPRAENVRFASTHLARQNLKAPEGDEMSTRPKTALLDKYDPMKDVCEPTLSVPNPFNRTALEGFYDNDIYPGENLFRLEQLWANLAGKVVSEMNRDCSARHSLRYLLDDGLKVHRFGMEFSEVFSRRKARGLHASGEDLVADTDVKKLQELYYATRVDRFFWKFDVPMFLDGPPKTHYVLSAEEQGMLDSFRRDGFVKIDQWPDVDIQHLLRESAGGLEMSLLQTVELGAHDAAHTNGPSRRKFNSLGRMLTEDSLLMKLSSGFLGGKAVVNNVSPFTLPASVTKTSYTNAPWHHDGCGLRLKAWVYLHDVDEHTHPTLIAAGTHKIQYYPTTQYFAGTQNHNKLNESAVRDAFGDKIHAMTGRKGGGFIFCTNALHAANTVGQHKDRRVVLIELSTATHVDNMPRGPRGDDDNMMSGFAHGLCPAQGDR
jgi:hypothetical protein